MESESSSPNLKLYLDLPEDVREMLESNSTLLRDELAAQGVDAEITYAPLPYDSADGAKGKEIVMVILAGTAAVLAVGYVVSQVLHTIQRRPRLVEIDELEELRDAAGQVMTDASGQPIFKPVKRYEMLEPKPEESKRQLEFSADTKGIVIKVGSQDLPIKEPRRSA